MGEEGGTAKKECRRGSHKAGRASPRQRLSRARTAGLAAMLEGSGGASRRLPVTSWPAPRAHVGVGEAGAAGLQSLVLSSCNAQALGLRPG